MPPHGPRGPQGAPKEKPKNARATLRRLVARLKPSIPLLVVVVIFTIAGTLCNTVSPLVLGQATTEVYQAFERVMAHTGGLDFIAFNRILLILILLYVAYSACQFICQFIMAKVTQEVIYGLRRDMRDKLDRVPLSYYDKRAKGEILSRVTNDVDLISSTLQETLVQIISAVVTLISVVIFMFSISWILALVAFATLPLSLVCTVGIASRSQKYFKRQQKALGNLNAHIEEMYSGYTEVKSFTREDRAIDKFNERNKAYFAQAWKAQFLSGVIRPVMAFIGNLGYVLVCIIGAALYVTGGIAMVGEIQAFIQYMRQFTMPITQIASIANTIQATLAAAERVFELLDAEEMREPDPAHVQLIPKPCEGAVAFEHVSFAYDPEKPVIKDFSLDVEPGQMVAIVGPTGAGKTTLVNLLMRFYDIERGTITIDGVNTALDTRHDVRSNFGMVLQDAWLFSGTIRENIAYGANLDPSFITDAETGKPKEKYIRLAAKLAQADHFIERLPDGYDTQVKEDGSNLSQGQRQLLTIARALLSNPSIIVLDEATSSIDTHTESLVQKAMRESLEGRTSFVIAHRLSTIRQADIILVIRDGDIVEKGTHEELLALDGFYAELHNSQFVDCIDESD